MASIGENTFVKVAHFFTWLFWHIFLISAIVFTAALLLGYFGGLPEGWGPVINLPMDSSLVSISENPDPEIITVGSASANIEFSYLARHHPEAYLSFTIAAILFLCIFIFGFYQLKRLLESTVNDKVFCRSNIRRIKTIALLVFLVDPISWFFREVFLVRPDFLGGSAGTVMRIGVDLDINYWFVGLLLFALAAVFEKGCEMYQELKLTV